MESKILPISGKANLCIESAVIQKDRITVNFDSPRSKSQFIKKAFFTIYFENVTGQKINKKLTFKVDQRLKSTECPDSQVIISLPNNLAKIANIVFFDDDPDPELDANLMYIIRFDHQDLENTRIAECDIFDTYYLYVSVWVELRNSESKIRFINEAYCAVFLESNDEHGQPEPIIFKVSDRLEYADNKTKCAVIVSLPHEARNVRYIICYDGDPRLLAKIIHIEDLSESFEKNIPLEEYFKASRKSAN